MAYDPLDFVERGRAAIVRRQFAEAIKICRLGLLAHPTLLDGRLLLATALTACGRWDEVLAETRAALELAPDDVEAWVLKGGALVAKADYRQAEQTLLRARELDPAHPRVDQLLAEIELARAAGFEGTPAEATATKVYPVSRAAAPVADDIADVTSEDSTHVDAHPSGALLLGAAPATMMPLPKSSSGPWLDEPGGEDDLSDLDSPEPPKARGGYFSFDSSDDELTTSSFERPLPPVPHSPMSEAFDIATPVHDDSIELEMGDLFVDTGPRQLDLADSEADESTDVSIPDDPDSDEMATREHQPLVRRPQPPRAAPPRPMPPRATPPPRAVSALPPQRSRPRAGRRTNLRRLLGNQLFLVGGSALVVVALGVFFGLFVRQWRAKDRLARRYAVAAADLARGDYRGTQAAAVLYRQILDEKDDPAVRANEARALASLAYEFGESPERALGAVASLPADPAADEARVLLALLGGGIDVAERRADALHRVREDAASLYLAGLVQLARDHTDAAIALLESTVARTPHAVAALYALGVAEAERGQSNSALAAFRRVLELNPEHDGARVARAALLQNVPELTRLTQLHTLSPSERAHAEIGLAKAAAASGDIVAAQAAMQRAHDARSARDTTLAEALADGYLAVLSLDKADEEARRALAGAGAARVGPRRVLAEVALLRERPADALAALEGAPSTVAVLVLQARALSMQRAATDGIVARLEAAVERDPNALPARTMLARLHGDLRELERLERAVPTADVAAALGLAYADTRGKTTAALITLAEAVRRKPLAVDVRLARVRLLRQEGKLADARQELDIVLELTPGLVPARRLQARFALEAGDAKTARRLYDDIAASTPDPDALLGGAEAALAQGDAAGADERVNRALALRPTLGEIASVMRARALIMEHRLDEAVSLLGAVVRNAESGETPALLMLAYLEQGNPARAFQVAILAPPRARSSPEVLAARSRLHLERGHATAAEAAAREALAAMDRKPTSAWIQSEALVDLGRSLWDQGTPKPALKFLRRAVELTPRSARAHHSLGLVLDEMRHDSEAAVELETALDLDSRLSDAHFFLGRVRVRLGDPRAADSFRAYLAAAPHGKYEAEAHVAVGDVVAKVKRKAVRRR